ncbi:MAG: ATP-binding protein [Panacagrimonas sp.]
MSWTGRRRKRATQPCMCGYLGDVSGRCRCTPDQVSRYRSKISGPLLDRIDLQLFVPRVEREALTAVADPAVETSATVRMRVIAARERQRARAGKPNARLTPKEIERDCVLDAPTKTLLDTAMSRMGLSARAYHRVLKVARTLADLGGAANISSAHLAEALRLRELDRVR